MAGASDRNWFLGLVFNTWIVNFVHQYDGLATFRAKLPRFIPTSSIAQTMQITFKLPANRHISNKLIAPTSTVCDFSYQVYPYIETPTPIGKSQGFGHFNTSIFTQFRKPYQIYSNTWIATVVHQYDGLTTFCVLFVACVLPSLSIFVHRHSSLATFAVFWL